MAFITATPAKRPPEAQFSQLHFGTPRAAPASTLCFTAHRLQPIAADFMLLCAPTPFFFLKLLAPHFIPLCTTTNYCLLWELQRLMFGCAIRFSLPPAASELVRWNLLSYCLKQNAVPQAAGSTIGDNSADSMNLRLSPRYFPDEINFSNPGKRLFNSRRRNEVMHLVPSISVKMIPAARNTSKWCDRVALEIVSRTSLQANARPLARSSSRTMATRPGSDKACITACRETRLIVGCE